MTTLKQLENEFRKAEKEWSVLYGELNRHLHTKLDLMVENEIRKRLGMKELKKSAKIFDIGFFDSIREQINEILQPLKFLSSQNDDWESTLLKLGLMNIKPTKDLYDIYNSVYNITHTLSNLIQQPKTNVGWRANVFEWMEENTGRHIDKHIFNYSNTAIDSIKQSCDNFEKEMLKRVEYRDSVRELVKQEMIHAVKERKSLISVKQVLKDTTKDYFRNWNLIVKTEFQMAKGTATSRCIEDIIAQTGEKAIVAIVDMDDDRVSDFCRKNSRNKLGNLKYFYYDDLKPAGYNLSRKRKDWKNSIPLRHFNCRCWTVFVPPGSKVNTHGHVVPLGDNEKITVEKTITS